MALLGNVDGREFYPIGTREHPFAGAFDGNGKAVSGLRITSATAAELPDPYSYVGLFGYCSASSSIRGLALEDSCAIDLSCADTAASVRYAGGLVGYSAGSVEGCASRARVSVSWDDGHGGDGRAQAGTIVVSMVGGVAGCVEGALTSSSYTGSLTVTTPANSFYDVSTGKNDAVVVSYVGGVAGRSGVEPQSAGLGVHGNVSGCSNAGRIAVYTTGESGRDRFGETVSAKSMFLGGVAGYASGNVSGCRNEGIIRSNSYVPNDEDAATQVTWHNNNILSSFSYCNIAALTLNTSNFFPSGIFPTQSFRSNSLDRKSVV